MTLHAPSPLLAPAHTGEPGPHGCPVSGEGRPATRSVHGETLFDPLPGSALPPVTLGPPAFDPALGLWRITRYDDVASVFSRLDRFASISAVLAHTPMQPAALRALARVRFSLPPTLPTNDAPSHAAIRKALMPPFTRPGVQGILPWVGSIADERCAELTPAVERGDRIDLAAALAWDLPARVFFSILGLPHSPTHVGEPAAIMGTYKRWARDSLELFWGFPTPQRQVELAEDAAQFYVWIRSLVEHARATEGDSLVHRLLALEFAPHERQAPLSDVEVCALLYFLLIAGQETTCQLITTCFHVLLRQPALWEQCQEEKRAAELVVEVLRTQTPVSSWRRRAVEDTEVGGVTIPAGQDVLLELTASGYDETHFADAHELVPGRLRARSHHAFGLGVHRCLGANLAEMEAGVIVHRAATAWPHLRLDDPAPEWIDWLSFRAPRTAWARHAHL